MTFKIATVAALAASATGVSAVAPSDYTAVTDMTSYGTLGMKSSSLTGFSGLKAYFDFSDPRSCVEGNTVVLDKVTGAAKLHLEGGLKCHTGSIDNYLTEIPNTGYMTQAPGYQKNYTNGGSSVSSNNAPSTVTCGAGYFFCDTAPHAS